MGKIVLLFLFVFATISSSLSLPSPSNSSPNPRGTKNVEEKMEELENFHAEFKDFKSSLAELSTAFGRFQQSVVAAANRSSTKPAPEPKNPAFQSISSCSNAMEILPSPRSKKQTIYPHGNSPSLKVLCDFETDGGGWTVIQKRSSGPAQEFNRNWTDYAQGFGLRAGNFWLGLENIHALTKDGDQELRIELEDFEGEKRYAKYSSFSISDASDFYRLSVRGFSPDSTAGDSMTRGARTGFIVDGSRFSTFDQDNDENPYENCVDERGGGWWFSWCSLSGLNGQYFEKGEIVPLYNGIFWHSWKGDRYSLAKSEMKIRKRK